MQLDRFSPPVLIRLLTLASAAVLLVTEDMPVAPEAVWVPAAAVLLQQVLRDGRHLTEQLLSSLPVIENIGGAGIRGSRSVLCWVGSKWQPAALPHLKYSTEEVQGTCKTLQVHDHS